MLAAVDDIALDPDLDEALRLYLTGAAHFMVNAEEEDRGPRPGLPLRTR